MTLNKKGQALIEFVIVLPIFIMLLLGFIDIGKILYFQNKLENNIMDIIDLSENGKTITDIKKEYKNIEIDINKLDEKTEYNISTKLDIITPGLNLIIKSPHEINVKKVVYNE